MKIAQLIAAFQKFSDSPEKTAETAPAKQPRPSAVAAARPIHESDQGDDIVRVSPEAVFLFAASQFDPRRISRNEVNELADTLRDGGAISPRDHAILSTPPDRRIIASATGLEPASPANLIHEFQGRLAYDMAQSNIAAVESDTRALAILGRLSSLRTEIL